MTDSFKFRKLTWKDLFGSYTTPRTFKEGARDIPFGLGAKSLYVDAATGNDANDGESWKTAFKSIQAAVNAADPWTVIFIKPGTYGTVSVSTPNIFLFGSSPSEVIIDPGSSEAKSLDVSGDNFRAENLTLFIRATEQHGSFLSANYCSVRNIIFDGVQDARAGFISGNHNNLSYIKITPSNTFFEGLIFSTSLFSRLTDSYFKNIDNPAIGLGACTNFNLFHNTFESNSLALFAFATCTRGLVFHNNFINNSQNISVGAGSCSFFENYFSDHSNVDNGFGIATVPYSFSGGADPRPVVCRDGWHSTSVQRSLLRKKTGKQTSAPATNANGDYWVDLKTLTPTSSDLELYRIKMTVGGEWSGTPLYRIVIGSGKVYPFANEESISSGTLVTFAFPIPVQINETVKVQFRSTNPLDQSGKTVTLDLLDYTEVL